MSRAELERRIFVVGAPRSGTTLVQSLLAAHSALTSFTESHFFARHFRPLPGWPVAILTRDPTDRVREFLTENSVPPELGDPMGDRFVGTVPPLPLRPLATRRTARRLVGVLDEVARSRKAGGWIEKTPRHLRHLGWLERLLRRERGVRFVHVVRDGLDVAASLRTASAGWDHPYDLATCVERWNADLALSLRRVGRRRDRFVFYEELTARPDAVLERLCGDLGLEWEREILERYGATSSRLITGEETWKAGVARPLRPAGTAERALDRGEREWARTALRNDLYQRIRDRVGLIG